VKDVGRNYRKLARLKWDSHFPDVVTALAAKDDIDFEKVMGVHSHIAIFVDRHVHKLSSINSELLVLPEKGTLVKRYTLWIHISSIFKFSTDVI
jgi:hypothetical protein